MIKLDTVVIYHAECTDGFCAAWLFSKAFPDAQFIPAKYGDPAPPVVGKQVYIVDFSYPRQTLLDLESLNHSLVVLDHHKTAQADCEGLDFCIFDMERSGAMLAWDYLKEHDNSPFFDYDHSPVLVDYVQDRDLWRFELPHSREINAAIRSYPMAFRPWDTLFRQEISALRVQGEAIERYRNAVIQLHIKDAAEVELAGYKVWATCCTTKEIAGDIANLLAEGRPFAYTYSDDLDGYRTYSLRSDENGVDVSEIAKRFGGGGHKHAAGFRMP